MAKVIWDEEGKRLYEAGLDRGVLYLDDGSGIPWNGLISIEQDEGDASPSPLYFDGVKYLDAPVYGDFKATLTAFTYPDEFLEYEGIVDVGNGLMVTDQMVKQFGLSYRTLVGNDIEGLGYGYKIHILYNLVANPNSVSYATITSETTPVSFSWDISGTPEPAPGYRATAHVIFDSRTLSPNILTAVENILYGSTETTIFDGGTPANTGPKIIDGGAPASIGEELPENNSRLPTIEELLSLV